ncbi:unnamed protein product, partial [Phaeothamnion confervicola]
MTVGVVRLHVGGLPHDVRESDVAALFSKAIGSAEGGYVASVEVMRDAITGIARGFGFVEVAGGDADNIVTRCAAFDGSKWRGGRLRVHLAKGDFRARLTAEWREAEEK